MSLLETPMLWRYRDLVGGTLAEEFPAVRGSRTASPRRPDGVIVPSDVRRRVSPRELEVGGRYIIVVQVKTGRLGMNVMGQALFSRELMKTFGPASIRSVIVCARDDSVLGPFAELYGLEVADDDPRADVRR